MSERTDEETYLAAGKYIERGWAVFPLHGIRADSGACTCGEATCGKNSGKHPRTRHGHNEATTDHVIITSWFDPNTPGYLPNSNIGIATGSVSGLVVMDIDPRHDGEQSLNDLELEASLHGVDLTTRSVITGSGGSHLFYAYPDLNTSVGGRIGLFPGIDIKSDGGYVVAPPSTHLSGRTYTWTDTTTAIAPLSDFLLELITNAPNLGGGAGGPLSHSSDLGAILRGEARIPLGSRDNVFYALASRLRGANVPETEAMERLGKIWELQTDQDPADPYPAEQVARKVALAYAKYEPNAALELAEGSAKWARSFNSDQGPQQEADENHPTRSSLTPGGLWDGYEGATDTARANGRRVAFRYQRFLRCFQYSRDTTWYRCQEGLWIPDHNAARKYASRNLEPTIRREAEQAADEDDQKRYMEWAKVSASAGAPKAAADYAADDALVLVENMPAGEYFDANPDQIAFPNGVVDLRSGDFRSLTPEDLVSRTCTVEYDPRLVEQCPRWFDFLELILPDPAVRDYVRLMLGMSLLGADKNHEFFILDGAGANGKSTLLTVVTSVLGLYAMPVPKTVFVQRRDDAHPADTADLEGLRFATNGTELKENDHLNEDLLKSIVSLEPFRTRKMHQDFWTLKPRCTLWLSTNVLPELKDVGIAMQRRLRRIRFEVTIPPPYDPLFAQKLVEAEGQAILATLVADCQRFLAVRNELVPPEAVRLETADYLQEEDPFAVFVAECLRPAPIDAGPADSWVPVSNLYQCYNDWCTMNGQMAKSPIWFGRSIGRFFPRGRPTIPGTGQVRAVRCYVHHWPMPEAFDIPTSSL